MECNFYCFERCLKSEMFAHFMGILRSTFIKKTVSLNTELNILITTHHDVPTTESFIVQYLTFPSTPYPMFRLLCSTFPLYHFRFYLLCNIFPLFPYSLLHYSHQPKSFWAMIQKITINVILVLAVSLTDSVDPFV